MDESCVGTRTGLFRDGELVSEHVTGADGKFDPPISAHPGDVLGVYVDGGYSGAVPIDRTTTLDGFWLESGD